MIITFLILLAIFGFLYWCTCIPDAATRKKQDKARTLRNKNNIDYIKTMWGGD